MRAACGAETGEGRRGLRAAETSDVRRGAAMDRLIVMDRGRIVEDGGHEDLLARGGLYASLWSRQSGGFIDSGREAV